MKVKKLGGGLALLGCTLGMGLCQPVQAAEYNGNPELLANHLMNLNRVMYKGEYNGTMVFTAQDKGQQYFGAGYKDILEAQARYEAALNERNKQYNMDHEADRLKSYNAKCEKMGEELRDVITEAGIKTNLSQKTLDSYADIMIMESQDRASIKFIQDRVALYAKTHNKRRGMDKYMAGARRTAALHQAMLPAWKLREAAELSGTPMSGTSYDENSMPEMAVARVKYATELYNMGFYDTEVSWQQALLPITQKDEVDVKKFKWDGELRWDHSFNKGAKDRDRLRLRLYGDYNIDNNWHFKTMAESEHWFSGDPWSSSPNNTVKIQRAYLQGYSGVLGMRIGWMGKEIAEGNVYDSDFKGVEVKTGSPVEYTAAVGQANDTDISYLFEASYLMNEWRLSAGYYHFKLDDDTRRRIVMMNIRKKVGNFDLGWMNLYGLKENDTRTYGYGFVASASLGNVDSSQPGSWTAYVKYYHQPRTTYLRHSMNGLADNANGFRGIGIGYERTVVKNLIASLEYDWLTDMENGQKFRTLWLALTWYFGG